MTHRMAEAFWILAPGTGAVRPCPVPPAEDGSVTVRTCYTGVSRGTESLVFMGRVPPSQYDAMRAPFQEGAFPAPVKYGYSAVGEVIEGPAELIGRHVFALHPHQTAFTIPTEAAVPLPEAVPPGRAILAANMETAINALWDARACVGDRIAVVGAGVVGCLVGYLAGRLPGTDVVLIDVDETRRDVAERLGIGFAVATDTHGEADLVFHASATEAGLATALSLAGFEAEIIELSWFGDARPALCLGEAFHSRRLSLRASQVGAVSPARRSRRTHRDRLALALRLLRDDRLDALVTGESSFHDLPQTMADLADGPKGVLCHRIAYP